MSGWEHYGIINTGDNPVFEGSTPAKKMRELFNSFDGRVNNLVGPGLVRMEIHHISRLQQLIQESGEEPDVEILGLGRRLRNCTIQNGSLGVQYSSEEQIEVKLLFRKRLNDQP